MEISQDVEPDGSLRGCAKKCAIRWKSDAINALPLPIGYISGVLVEVVSLHSLNSESRKLVGGIGSGLSFLGAGINIYGWYKGRTHTKSAWHCALEGVVIFTNITSAVASVLSASSDDPEHINAYDFIASVAGVTSLFFKAVDLIYNPVSFKVTPTKRRIRHP